MIDTKEGSLPNHSSGIGSRIGLIADLYPTRTAAAAAAGISVISLRRYITEEQAPAFEVLARLALAQGVSLEWLATGNGQMRKGPEAGETQQSANRGKGCPCVDTLGNPVNLDEFVFIPRYNLKAAAGHGATTEGEKPMFSMAFRRYWIENYLRATPTDLSVISVKGDSMEGVLNDRDVILLNTSDTQASSGLYVLRVDGDLVVKRVQRLPGGILRVISANEAYATFDVDLNNQPADFGVIGRVVWFGRQI